MHSGSKGPCCSVSRRWIMAGLFQRSMKSGAPCSLSFDVRAGDADYIADFKAGGVQDYIILPSAYSGLVYLTQYGTDVIGYIAQGPGYYSFQVHSANPLTVAEVQAALFFA